MLDFLQHRDFAIITIIASLPAFFIFALHNPANALKGVPYLILYMWSVVSVPLVPVVLLLEALALALMTKNVGQGRAHLRWHIAAAAVATSAALIYFTPLGDWMGRVVGAGA